MRGPETDQKPKLLGISQEQFERYQALSEDPDFQTQAFLWNLRREMDQRRREGENLDWLSDFIRQTYHGDPITILSEKLLAKGYSRLELDVAGKVSSGSVELVVLKP